MENQKPNLSENLIISLLVIWFVPLVIVFIMNSLDYRGVTNEKPRYILK